MQLLFYIFLFILGSIFGSFASVLIWRIKNKKTGIITGRSYCPKCKHALGFFDLVPIFSYLFLLGKCRYCEKKVKLLYPALEILMGLFFVLSGVFLVDFNLILSGNIIEIIKILFFLFISFNIVIIIFYDILFMEVSDEIIIPSTILILILLIVGSVWNNANIFGHFQTLENTILSIPIINALIGAFIIYTFFYLQIFISGLLYALKSKNKKLIIDLLILYFIFPFYFGKDEKKSKNKKDKPEEIPFWMGFGDLRIAIFMGFVAGIKISLLGLILAYIIGSIIGIFIIFKKKSRNIKVPFGPFLGIGLFLALILYNQIINLYLNILQ